MTREQRRHSEAHAALAADLEFFVDKPVRLAPHQVEAILNELCSDFGICLTPHDYETVEADPPTEPRAFAELVMNLEGVGSSDPELFLPVVTHVLRTFQGAAQR